MDLSQNMKNYSTLALFWLSTILLASLGLLFLFEASVAESFITFDDQYHLVRQQAIGMGAGLCIALITWLIPLQWWQKASVFMYWGSIVLLAAVFIPGIGLTLNGAARWISLGGIVVQPVEFVKIALIIYFSSWLQTHQRLGPFATLTAIPLALLLLQPDVGSLLIVSVCAISVFYISGGKIFDLLKLGLLSLPVLAITIIMQPYRMERITTFLNPGQDLRDTGFHVRQISLALGRGQLWGAGLTNSIQRYSWVPEASSDSIFAIVAEEVGFIGSLAIIALFGLYILSGSKLAAASGSPYAQVLGFSLVLWIAAQCILNLAAVVQLVPLTGIPLPFFSYGRSSLLMVWFATGLISRIGTKS